MKQSEQHKGRKEKKTAVNKETTKREQNSRQKKKKLEIG